MNGKEIEIKLEISLDEYQRLLEYFEKNSSKLAEKHQIDVYYSPKGMSLYQKGDRCIRVRTEKGQTILSYKQIHNENTDKQYIEEYETYVDSFKTINHILNALNFYSEITVDKSRKEFIADDSFLVALDCVLNLGYFIEVENRNNQDSLTKQNLDLQKFIRDLHLDMSKRNNEGYSNMLYRKIQGKEEGLK